MSKRTWIIIGVVVLVLVLIGLGIYFYNKKNNKNNSEDNSDDVQLGDEVTVTEVDASEVDIKDGEPIVTVD